MKRLFLLCVFLVIVMIALIAALLMAVRSDAQTVTATAAPYAGMSLPSRDVVTSLEGVYVVGVVVRDSSGVEHTIYLQPDGALPTPTLQPSPTATVPPTNTARPSLTPTVIPTWTPTPSAEPPSPTQEVTTLPTIQFTAIPKPTETPQPTGEKCVLVDGLRVRRTPSLSGEVLGTVNTGRKFETFGISGDFTLITWNNGPAWVWTAYLGACGTARIPAFGFHSVPGAAGGEMVAAFSILQQAGIPYGAKVINDNALCQSVEVAGGICVSRSVHPGDCPNVDAADPKQEAYLWLLALSPYLNGSGASYYEITNECLMDADHLARFWNPFLLEAIRLAKAWGWPPLVAPSWNPGAPEEWTLDLIKPALMALRDSGGALGLHAYAVTQTDLCTSSDWLGYRYRRTHAKLAEMGLGDLPLALTEVGRGEGNAAPDVADFVCWYRNVKQDSYVLFVALWTAGPTGAWPLANLNGWLLPIARAVVQ